MQQKVLRKKFYKMSRNKKEINPRLGTVGGEAVIEGVMMRSKERLSIAVRQENGGIVVKNKKIKTIKDKAKFFRIPFIRGIVNFVEALIMSYSTLNDATAMLGIEEEPGKFEKWLKKKFGASLMSVMMVFSIVFAIALVAALFVYLPIISANGIEKLLSVKLGYWKGAVEGVFKVIIFVLYLFLASLLPDMHRVFEYHGAEHKTVFCYEKGLELTVENVKKQRRFHPRCGTALMFVIIIISIIVSSFIPPELVTWERAVLKILLLPIVVGIGYEFIAYAGKHENAVTRTLSAPGLWMQRITTKEPDASQMECAIAALKSSMPSVFPDYAPVQFTEAKEPEKAGEVKAADENDGN